MNDDEPRDLEIENAISRGCMRLRKVYSQTREVKPGSFTFFTAIALQEVLELSDSEMEKAATVIGELFHERDALINRQREKVL